MSARAVCPCGWIGGPYNTPARAAAMADKHVCERPTRQVRKANRRHRCARCGYQATYPDAGAAEARHWFGLHSCQKRENAMVRAAHAALREALVDRTPQPCLHKYANHQHGQRATYVLDRCRCEPCSKANAEAETWRERQKAYGRYNKYVPAEFVREHLAELAAYGIGLKRVAKLSGVGTGTLSKIVYGVYAPAEGPHKGCNGSGDRVREPTRRVLRSTAEKIYDVEAIPANLGICVVDHQRTPTARLHIRALVALGWSMTQLGRRIGVTPGNIHRVIGGEDTMQRGMVDKVEALYAALSMTLPPETGQRQRISVSRARNYAKAHGWLPPLALDDEPMDDGVVVDGPDLDEAAIYRRLHGDKSVRLTKPERYELARRWVESGRPLAEMERHTGLNSDRYLPDVEEAS